MDDEATIRPRRRFGTYAFVYDFYRRMPLRVSRSGAGTMEDAGKRSIELHNGDRVGLVDDDWSLVGHDLILVDLEPVPGSTQCVVSADGETRTVSRAQLRPI